MNAEFKRLISTFFESPARSAQAWAPPLTSGRPRRSGVRVRRARRAGGQDRRGDRDNTLTVSGSRERAEKLEDERFFRYERRFGDFTRSVALPQGCGEGEAQAHYANGALEVHVKKPEQARPRRVPIMTTVEAALPSSTN